TIPSGVWEVVNDGVTTSGSIAANDNDVITGGEITFFGQSTLDTNVSAAVSGGRLTFRDTSVLNANNSDSVIEANITLFEGSSINVTSDEGVCDDTNITFDSSMGGVGGTLKLNGHYIPIGSISSVGASGVITNNSATPGTLSLFFDDVSRTFSGFIQDGGAGALDVVKDGTGTQVLNGANTYTGGTVLNAGTLGVGNNDALGTGGLQINDGALVVSGGSDITLANPILAAGSFTINRPIDDVNFPSLHLGGPMTIVTDITITNNDNTFFAGDIDETGGSRSLTFRGDGLSLISGDNTYAGGTTIYSAVEVSSDTALGTGTVTLKEHVGNDPGGSLQSATTAVVLANNIVLDSPTYLSIRAVEPLTLNGTVSGTGGISTFFAGDVLTLNGNNTYQAGTLIFGSTIAVGHDNALGTGPVSILGELDAVSGPRTIANNIALGGATFGGTSSFNFTGPVHLDFGAPIVANIPVTFGGVVSGSENFIKQGTSSLTLSATNTYTGATFVDEGTLVVTGSIATSALTSVGTSGTLAGTGTVGPLEIIAGGTLSPGTASSPIGVLSSAATTWGVDGAFAFDINNATGAAGTNYDSLNITGALAITSTYADRFVFKITTLNGTTPGNMANYTFGDRYEWLVATATGGITGFDLGRFSFDTTGFSNPSLPYFSLQVMGNNLYLVAVPEPSTYAVGITALLGLVIVLRRRKAA
ncbi:MAG: autotransporter-associated beta strand repeat-containing protein, partial [Chthoniobacterales bacterium]